MLLKEQQISIINLLVEHEKAIGELYQTYADKLQEHSDFWTDLSKEELEHAGWIMSLTEEIKKDKVYFNEGRFAVEAIKSSLVYVKKQIVKAKDKLLLIEALSVAYDLEMALIEKKYFEIFEEDSVELKHVLMRLSEATKIHQETIKDFLDKERKKRHIGLNEN